MSEPYTPTEDYVREGYAAFVRSIMDWRDGRVEFDRWLAQVRAEAYEQARRDMQADFDASVDLYRREGAVEALREAADQAYPMMHLNEYHVKGLGKADLLDLAARIEAEG